MWKKMVLALFWASPLVFAVEQSQQRQQSEDEIKQLKQRWLVEQRQAERIKQQQREDFLQFESLLKNAIKQGRVSERTLALAQRLRSADYPLQAEAELLWLEARLASEEAKQPQNLVKDIQQFSGRYPSFANRSHIAQGLYPLYYQQGNLEALVAYAQNVPAKSLDNQCLLFSARYQLLAEKEHINPELAQASGHRSSSSTEMEKLLNDFDQFWLKEVNLPSACAGLESYWRDQGLNTHEKIRQKVLNLVEAEAKFSVEALSQNLSDPALVAWISEVQKVTVSPSHLQRFADNQPLTLENRTILLKLFPKFILTLPEQMDMPNFSLYQSWVERWNLTQDEQKLWKVAFIQRQFDHPDPVFQLWRDEQLRELKVDNLTERRLRMAILHQKDLKEWLNLLSSEAQAKAEWRYWWAKNDPNQRIKLLTELAKERGFYPMLAANALGKSYRFEPPQIPPLNEAQRQEFAEPLARITELRALKRFGAAKLAWIDLLQAVDFKEKMALIDDAVKQDWFDLAVEGTIQAKAWDYLSLRLPNAYDEWFEINLKDTPVSKSFAMAIARQESAWNVEARSHANAIGLMQMLSSTAKQTADDAKLPYSESDLYSPFRNIMLGTAHLNELNEKYPNNRILIAAAYNAGQPRVARWLARAGGRLAMDEFIASIPFLETRGYVQNVLAYDYYYQILQNKPEKVMFSDEEQRKY